MYATGNTSHFTYTHISTSMWPFSFPSLDAMYTLLFEIFTTSLYKYSLVYFIPERIRYQFGSQRRISFSFYRSFEFADQLLSNMNRSTFVLMIGVLSNYIVYTDILLLVKCWCRPKLCVRKHSLRSEVVTREALMRPDRDSSSNSNSKTMVKDYY